MPASQYTPLEERVLVLMPNMRDAHRAVQLLGEAGVTCFACRSLRELCSELRAGAAALLLADELIVADGERVLEGALSEQPPWSALPVIVLAAELSRASASFGASAAFRGVIIAERPVRTRSLVSLVHSALRARRNQYEIRDAISERERQETELARQADQLRTADRLKDEFLATLAHELRNPLAPITTGLELLSSSQDAAASHKTVGVMQRQVSHMVRLIDDLLDVSRITSGKLELKRERISLASVLDAAIEGSMPYVQRAGHTLRTSLTSEPLFLDADHTRVAQVISNLLNNATKYTPPGGLIELATRHEDGFVIITITDNGLGIPPDRLEDVFEMFSQVNRRLDRSQGGLGIGLALVRTLVRMHGGTVDARSAGPDQGSTFTVRLPLADSAMQPSTREVAPSPPTPPGRRILVVDDNDDAAELLSLMLENAGYETAVAHDGQAALAAAEQLSPDFVILDIGMPGMNGYQVAEQLRKSERLAKTGLIALTGWGTPEDRRKALAAGFDVHLTKPVVPAELKDAMRRAALTRSQHTARPD